MKEEVKSLHEAVINGSYSKVCSLINDKIDVNERDSNGNTPLLLTVCIRDEEIHNKIVRVLIENGADVNATNKGYTILYNAVFYKRTEAIKMLLSHGAWMNTHSNHFELHLLAQRGDKELLKLFLKDPRCSPEMINFADFKGRTAVYFAAENCHKSTLKLLLKYGATLTGQTEDVSLFEVMFEEVTTPVQFLEELFDSQIVLEKVVSHHNQKKTYIVNFSLLSPESLDRQMTIISNLLASVGDEEKTELLQHPLIDLFLSLKWLRIRNIFYWIVFVFMLFALSIGTYVTLGLLDTDNKYKQFKMFVCTMLLLTSIILFVYVILQFLLVKSRIFRRFELWFNLVCSSLCLIVAVFGYGEMNLDVKDRNWVLHVTSLAVLLAWIELMLLIGRLPTFGYYALMFAAVLQDVIKVLFTFLCLIIGFALAFMIQFHNITQFNNPWRAVIKTTMMMMGEFEYSTLFYNNLTGTSTLAINNGKQKYSALWYDTLAQLFFVAFIILTSVVLMNLMVGLAVSDIQGLQEKSHAKKLEKQAEFIQQIEEVCHNLENRPFLPQCLRRHLYILTRMSPIYYIEPTASFRRKSGLSKKVIAAIVKIAKSNSLIK